MMEIGIYESVVNEDGSISTNYEREVAFIGCYGDYTPGDIIFYDTCNEIWTVKDKKHPLYGKERVIFDDTDKLMLRKLFNRPIDIITDGGWEGDRHFIEGKTLYPWYHETIRYIVNYSIKSFLSGGTIHAILKKDKPVIVKELVERLCLIYLHERAVLSDGTEVPGRIVGRIDASGDGRPGLITFYPSCDEIREINDVNNPFYGKETVILDEEQKKMIENRIRNPIYIGGEDCDDPSGRKMEPWHR